MAEHQRAWEILVENHEAVIAALERDECASILPAAGTLTIFHLVIREWPMHLSTSR
jgi:hypothetical protein